MSEHGTTPTSNGRPKATLCLTALEDRALPAPLVYMTDTGDRLNTYDFATNTFRTIGILGEEMADIAFSPEGRLYAVSIYQDLYEVDPNTASTRLIGDTNQYWDGIVFGRDGTLYGTDLSRLYRINTETAAVTEIGSFSPYTSYGNLAFDKDNNLFLLATPQTNPQIIRLNKDTGAPTLVGSTGLSSIDAMAYGPDEQMYAATRLSSLVRLLTIDLSNGAATEIRSFAGSDPQGMAFTADARTEEQEPNNAIAQATRAVSPVDTLVGTIESVRDQDHYRLYLRQGETWRVGPDDAAEDGNSRLGPALEILNENGVVLASAPAGHALAYTVAAEGSYYLRLSSANAFEDYTGSYLLRSYVESFNGVTEVEPNGSLTSATPTTGSGLFRGELTSASDSDYFSVSLAAGQAITVAYTGRPVENPTTRLFAPNGALLATDRTGAGLHFIVPSSGLYRIALQSDNTIGTVTGPYIGQVLVVDAPTAETESGSGISDAVPVDLGPYVVASTYLSPDPTFATQGLLGSYVNTSLRGVAAHQDWRITQAIAGTRLDPTIHFPQTGWGRRAPLNLTNGSDNDWESFSVQWDGYIRVVDSNTQLSLASDDGGRLWIDLNNDGVFNSTGAEYLDNSWGSSHDTTLATTGGIAPGTYKIRIQYEEGIGGNNAYLLWTDKARSTGVGPRARPRSAVGTLDSVNDVDTFAFDLAATGFYEFRLQTTEGRVSTQNREMLLYDQFGRLLESSVTGVISTDRHHYRPEYTGRYYLSVRATNATGLGGYSMMAQNYREFPQYRDVPLFYHNYTNYSPQNQVPEFIAFFESQYDIYQVDVTQTAPSSGTESVGWEFKLNPSGGHGGVGGGWFGERRPSGGANGETNASYTSLASVWHGLAYHENGHGVGLPHTRHPFSTMNYGGQYDYFPHGTYTNGQNRTPAPKVQNERSYLDWILDAGRVVLEGEDNNTQANAQQLQTYFTEMSGDPDPRNDQVILAGAVGTAGDEDWFSLVVAAGDLFSFDIDSAEFQYALNAQLDVYSADGTLLATNRDALDRDTGVSSVDPFLSYQFATPGTYYVRVTGEAGTFGPYRLRLTPQRAFDQQGPRVSAMWPDGSAVTDGTSQLIFWFNDQIDPATVTAANIEVRGSTTGLRAGTAIFDPLDSTITWRATTQLPPDTYTVTLKSGTGGITDLRGNLLDGETDGALNWPEVSGNGSVGGNFTSQFVVTTVDHTPASVMSAEYFRHDHNRGMLDVWLSDELDVRDVYSRDFLLRGSGLDRTFGTSDDTQTPIDIFYDRIGNTDRPLLRVYTRGVPDPDTYRLEGSVLDAAGFTVNLHVPFTVLADVPAHFLFTDAGGSTNGLVGSYVNRSLRDTNVTDWRGAAGITIAGTRNDPVVAFSKDSFGLRSSVNLTNGSDDNWDDFSVQWDGFIQIPANGVRLMTRSDDGSRLWIDLNNDGVFNSSGSELINNNWGSGQGTTTSPVSTPLLAGIYRIRIQYEDGGGGNRMILGWDYNGANNSVEGTRHGLSVIDVNVQPNTTMSSSPQELVVTFSGVVNPATLTTNSVKVWHSPDPEFFDGNDTLVADADGQIAYDATKRQATFRPAQWQTGYYLLELDGDTGGIAAPGGRLLDGEPFDGNIPGYDPLHGWQDAPSGDSRPGGDFLAPFQIRVAELRGSLFLDSDVDGIRDLGEQGLSGYNVYLDQNNNQVRDTGEPLATTTADGTFAFLELEAGTYKVRVALATGWYLTAPVAGFQQVTLAAGEVVNGLEFAATPNDAPVYDNSGSTVVSAILEDPTENNGMTIVALVASAGGNRITDPDAAALEGIAVIAADTTNGEWQFSLDGVVWQPLGEVSATDARLLAADANTRLRFVPLPNFFGTIPTAISFRAWDQTAGTTNGGRGNTSLNGGYYPFSTAIETASMTVTAMNDVPQFTQGNSPTVNEDSGEQTINPWATNISAGPPNESSQTLTFEIVFNSNPSLFQTAPAINESGVLTFTPAPNVSGSATIDVRVRDNGGTTNGGINVSGNQSFSIHVLPVNDQPTFTKGGAQSILEDAAAQYVAGWATGINAGAADESNQVLTFHVSTDNDALFATLPSIDHHGNLSYQAAPDAFGTATVTVFLKDNGGTSFGGQNTSASQTFAITILPVNDAPSAAGGSDQEVNEDAGPQFVANWASKGSAHESNQNLTFELLSNSNPGLFAVQPTIDAAGNLTYTPQANTSGSAVIQFQLVDDGGTDNGGDNRSDPMTLTITVHRSNDLPTWDPIDDMLVDEDTTEQTIALAGITVGPPDEAANQTIVSVVATSDNPDIIPNPIVEFNAGTYTLKLTPLPNANGTATIHVTVTDDGGTDHGGVDQVTQTFVVEVTPQPDAPVLDTTPTTMLNPIPARALNPTGTDIAGLVASTSDVDNNDQKGIAIVGLDAVNSKGRPTGVWQFSLDGFAWVTIPSVTPSNALLLASDGNSRVRFLPLRTFTGFAGLRYRAWDRSNGLTEGSQADTTVPNNTTFSDAIERAWVAVGRTRPTVNAQGATVLPEVREDARYSRIVLVKNMIGIAGLETGGTNLGIAITSTQGSGGVWQYRLYRTRSWVTVQNVDATNALLLGPNDALRFIPDPNADGEGRIVFKTWNQSMGSTGHFVTPNGNAFGINPGTAVLDITAVNDHPVLDTTLPAILNPIAVGGATNDGITLGSLLSATDIEGADVGVAIIASRGSLWQYRRAGDDSWQDVGFVSMRRALFLDLVDEVRITNALAGTATLSLKAWDRTNGISAGTRGVARGTAISRLTEILTVAVGNQAPSYTPKYPVLLKAGVPVSVRSLLGPIADTPKSLRGIAVIGSTATNGHWEYSLGGSTWIPFPGLTPTTALLLTETHRIRFVATGAGTSTLTFKAWDQSTGRAGDTNVDTTGLLNSFSSETDSVTILI